MRSEEFVSLLAAASSGVQVTCQQVIDEWHPEEPPVTTLFAAIGERIADDFEGAGSDANHLTFSLIEQAMESGDQELVTAVATGLIEALVTRVVQNKYLWKQMDKFLGPKSRHHAEAWLASI